MKKLLMIFVFMLFVATLQSSAFAASIPGLYSTGVDDAGVVRGSDFSADLHYSVVTPSLAVETPTVGSRSGYWHTLSSANWIGLDTASTGWYTYSLDFDLTGYDPATASFSAEWLMDNTGYALLNGNEIAGSRYLAGFHSDGVTPWEAWGFQNKTSFSAASGFQEGVNTLEFKVWNGGGPTGVDVAILSSNVNAVVTPEPASMVLFGLGGAAMAFFRRNRKA